MEPDPAVVRMVGRIIQWGRNGDHDRGDRTGVLSMVISGTDAVVDWLTDPRVGLLREDTMVLVRESRTAQALPESPGQWRRFSGALDEPGDEIQIGNDFWVQAADYASLPYLAITGLTIVRLYTAEDAAAYLADVRQALRTGRIPQALLHPAVQLGDRCALSGGLPCTANGLGARLHVAADRSVRTMAGGRIIGEVGDSQVVLTGSAHALSTQDDLCVDGTVTAALREAERAELSGFLAALDALRLMAARTGTTWKASGLGYRVAEAALGEESAPPRTDLLLLSSATGRLLYDARSGRGFTIPDGMAEILDVVLHTAEPDLARERLHRCPNVPTDPVEATAMVRAELARRGVELPTPVLRRAA
jgi:hypothetical protein